eukprot:9952778-Lingulodinium_polyedra.AAC.1
MDATNSRFSCWIFSIASFACSTVIVAVIASHNRFGRSELLRYHARRLCAGLAFLIDLEPNGRRQVQLQFLCKRA